jgi:hypothetical protein
VSVYCKSARGCLQDGWVVKMLDPTTERDRATPYNCLGSGCWFSGWTADHSIGSDYSNYERTKCSQAPLYCFRGGWITQFIRDGKVVNQEQATCLPTQAGARSCLEAGWTIQEKFGATRTILCKQNSCRNAGWTETRNGKSVQDVTCMQGGCFEQGWTYSADL